MQDLSTKIALRFDTAANWESANPILLSGEIAVVIDGQNQLFKVGDGTRNFNDLPYSFYEQFASKLVQTDLLKAKSISQGYGNDPTGIGDIATGYKSKATSNFAQAHGYQTTVSSDFGYVWNGDNSLSTYADHGRGTFNVNPLAGLDGFYVGNRRLSEILAEYNDLDAINRKLYIDGVSADSISAFHIDADEYHQKVIDGKVLSNELYILSSDHLNAYGQQIKNVATPELSDDAATKDYVDQEIAKIPAPDLTEYYKKAETSSATEIQNAFDNIPKPDMSEYYKKAETSSASEISSILNDFAKISVDNEPTQDLHLRHVSYDEYSKLVADEQVDPHTLYILSAEGQDDQFGDRIVNVGAPISADDAATKGYVDNAISSIPAPDLSNYVKTSSDVEQKISSDIYVKGWVKVGNLSVGSSTLKSEWGWIVGDIERQKDLKSKFDYVESEIGTVSSDLIITKAEAADIKTKIPNEATSDNQLADKDFVNSSIVTNTAYFKGTYDSVEELPTTRVTPNDYAFVIRNDEVGQTFYDRYKFTADGEWLFEYSINNSGFTAAQFAAINSGVTSSLVQKYNGYEGQIAQKANASSLTSYYTKSEVDAKIPAVPTLAGMTFDFSSNAAIYESLSALITKLGGTVTNMPEKMSGYNVYVDANYMYEDPTIHKFSFDGGKTFMNSGQLNSYKGQLVASNLQPGEFQFWDDTGMGFNYHFEGEPAQSRVFNSGGLSWMVFPNDNNLNVYIDYSTV